jgi:DNA polymerase-3 subunit delta'
MAGRLLDRLPAVDWRDVHRLADGIGGREGDDAFDAIIETIFDWLARVTRGAAPGSPRRLAPYADVWEKIAQSVRETEALNLDRRRLVLSVFADLAAAVRASSA